MSDPDLYRSGITENKIYELEQTLKDVYKLEQTLKDVEQDIQDLKAQIKQELLDVGQRLRMGLKEEAQYYIDEIRKAYKDLDHEEE